MVTQKEYAEFQDEYDRAHREDRVTETDYSLFQDEYDRAHREGRVTETDYALFQSEHDRTHPLNPDGSPAYVTQEEYTRFQNSYGNAEPDRPRVPYSMRPSRPQGTYTGKPMTPEEIAERDKAQEKAWRDFWKRNGMLSPEEEEELRLKKEAEEREWQEKCKRIHEEIEEANKKREEHRQRVSAARRKNKAQDQLIKESKSPLGKRLARNAYGGTKDREERDELIKRDDKAKELAMRFPKRLHGG